MRSSVLKFLRSVRNFVFPPKCIGCGELLDMASDITGEKVLCKECFREWELAKHFTCEKCGCYITDCRCIPKAMRNSDVLLKNVVYDPTDIDAVANKIIYLLKKERYGRATEFVAVQLSRPISILLEEYGADIENTVITYCPRRRESVARYGTDQAEEIAKRIADISGAKFRQLIMRRKNGKEQKGLSRSQRAENASFAFEPVSESCLNGETVVLIDDVSTTGSTLSVCAGILKNAGAGVVICAVIASTQRHTGSQDDKCL